MQQCHAWRKQILGTRGLGIEDFSSLEEANTAADNIIKHFQEKFPQKVIDNPNQINPGMPQIDQFWFVEYKGTWDTNNN